MTSPNNQTILGVEREIIEGFIRLFAEHYEKVDEATFLLEHEEGISNASGIANVRDAVSHFTSALKPGMTLDQRREQLTSTLIQ